MVAVRRIDPFRADPDRRMPAARVPAGDALGDPGPVRGSVLLFLSGRRLSDLAAASAAAQVADGRPVLGAFERMPPSGELPPLGLTHVLQAGADSIGALREAVAPAATLLVEDRATLSDAGRRLAAERGLRAAVRVVAFAGGAARSATRIPGAEEAVEGWDLALVDRRFCGPAPKSRVPRRVRLRIRDDLRAARPDVERLETWNPSPDETHLSEARFVAAAGAGVRDVGLFRRFADALGASVGASRALADTGRLERDRQIGASGTAIDAELYLALGISGAVQHLEGIAECRHVLSVNTDPSCPMALRAETNYVADAEAFMRAVLERLERGQ